MSIKSPNPEASVIRLQKPVELKPDRSGISPMEVQRAVAAVIQAVHPEFTDVEYKTGGVRVIDPIQRTEIAVDHTRDVLFHVEANGHTSRTLKNMIASLFDEDRTEAGTEAAKA